MMEVQPKYIVVSLGLFLVTLVCVGQVYAQGSQIETRRQPPGFGQYQETIEDMRVKVMGGFVRVTRTYDTNTWHVNRRWSPIKEIRTASGVASSGGGGSGVGSSGPLALERNDRRYERVSDDTYVDEFNNRRTITKTDTGYRWQDRRGNWIEYDENRRVAAYGDRNNVQVTLQYDADGKLTGVFDHFGNQILWYEYNIDNQISAIRDYTERRVVYNYTNNKLTEVIDVLGNPWTYEYTGNLLTSKTDPEGRTITIAYAPNNTLEQILDQNGGARSYRYEYDKTRKEFYQQEKSTTGKVTETWYDKEGDLIRRATNGTPDSSITKDGRVRAETDSVGNQTVKQYDEWDNITKITYPDGATATNAYDPVYSNVLEEVNENGVVTKFDYDDNGNLIRMTEAAGLPEQRITEFTYDQFGNRTTIRRLADANTQEVVRSFTYDSFANVLADTDAENNTTEYTYDVMGNLLTRKDPRDNVWANVRDDAGRLLSESDPLGNIYTYSYDKIGNRITVTDPDGQTTQTQYDETNRLIAVIDPNLATTRFEYDTRGPSRIVDPEGKVRTLDNDLRERLISVTDGVGNTISYEYGGGDVAPIHISAEVYPTSRTEYRYDTRGRQTMAIANAGGTEPSVKQLVYDGVGNLKQTIDPEGKVTRYDYDGLNRATTLTKPSNDTIQYDYDNRDNPINLTNENNVVLRRFEYDRNNRVIKETWAEGEIFSYTYDANGNRITKTDAKGQATKYAYDAANRPTKIEYFQSITATTPLTTTDYTYDKQARLTSYSDGTTSGSYTYDALGRKLTETVNYDTFSKSLSYTYYQNGLKRTFTGPDNITYTYSYDAANRFSELQIPDQGAIIVNRFEWLAPAKVTLPGGSTREIGYDPLLRTEHLSAKDPAGNTLMEHEYSYDKADNVLAKTTQRGVHAYTYDGLDRLVGASHPTLPDETYSYDPAGNRLTSSATPGAWQYNSNNQLTSYGITTLKYDENGNAIEKIEGAQTTEYVYDTRDRLTQIKNSAGTIIASFYYDPFGRRLWKETDGAKTYYLYAEEGLIAEFDRTGTQVQSYGYAPGGQWSTDPAFTKTAQGYAFYLNDHLGTPQSLTTANGTLVWAATYTAFGEAIPAGNTFRNNLRFPGQYYDVETQLHYNHFRNYDPKIGRYITSDPIGLYGGLNAYLYGSANPLRFIDVSGLKILSPFNPGDWTHCVDIDVGRGTDESETYSYNKERDRTYVGPSFDNVTISLELDRKGKKIGLEADWYSLYVVELIRVEGIYKQPYVDKKFFCKKIRCGRELRWEEGPRRFLEGDPWFDDREVGRPWHALQRKFLGRGPVPFPYRIPIL